MDTSDDVSIDVMIVTEHHNEAQKQGGSRMIMSSKR